MLYNKEKKKVYSNLQQIREDFSTVFTKDARINVTEGYPHLDLLPLDKGVVPEYDKTVESVKPAEVVDVLDEDGNLVGFKQTYVVYSLTEDEILEAQKQEAYLVTLRGTQVRSKRNGLLTDCDWVITKSVELGESVSQEWLDYRQDLRDVTAQEGYPFNVIWPTKPE